MIATIKDRLGRREKKERRHGHKVWIHNVSVNCHDKSVLYAIPEVKGETPHIR